MSKFDRYKAVADGRPMEWQMPETFFHAREDQRRVEPIFDASGSLKRHILSKLDAEHTEKPDTASRDDTNTR